MRISIKRQAGYFFNEVEMVELRDTLTESLCHRFQGALLGIWLAPVALSPERGEIDRLERRSKAIAVGSNASAESKQSLLHRAIDCAMIQIRAFMSAPSHWAIDLANLPNSTFWLPACLPVLLLYHHSWRKRLAWLKLMSSQANSPESGLSAIAQILLIGDLLEAMSADHPPTDWLFWLTERSARYRREPWVYAQYETVLTVLTAEMRVEDTPFGQLSSGHVFGREMHQAFAVGVSSALRHPESYLLAIRGLAGYAPISASQMGALPASCWASSWLPFFVAGLLSGALGGRRVLPALWQLRLSAECQANLASELFSLWAGQRIEPVDDLAGRSVGRSVC